MYPPHEWTFATFAVLSSLRDGEPRTQEDIIDVLNWPECTEGFRKLIKRIERKDLISRNSAVVRSASGTRNRFVYAIRPTGQQLWLEMADWFSFMLELQPDSTGCGDILAMKPAQPVPQKAPQRLPTPDEERQMRRHVTPETAACWDVVKAMPASMALETLFALDVPDVDLERRTIRVNGRKQPMHATFRSALARAIGDRDSGPAVIARKGGRYCHHSFWLLWRIARQNAGVPAGVCIRRRPTTKGRRRRRRAI